jgi:hypothetical protein
MIHINPNENHILVLELSTPLYKVPGKARSIGKVRPRGPGAIDWEQKSIKDHQGGSKRSTDGAPHHEFRNRFPNFFAVGFDDSMTRQW